jgi:hypothetical protein
MTTTEADIAARKAAYRWVAALIARHSAGRAAYFDWPESNAECEAIEAIAAAMEAAGAVEDGAGMALAAPDSHDLASDPGEVASEAENSATTAADGFQAIGQNSKGLAK